MCVHALGVFPEAGKASYAKNNIGWKWKIIHALVRPVRVVVGAVFLSCGRFDKKNESFLTGFKRPCPFQCVFFAVVCPGRMKTINLREETEIIRRTTFYIRLVQLIFWFFITLYDTILSLSIITSMVIWSWRMHLENSYLLSPIVLHHMLWNISKHYERIFNTSTLI